MKREEKKEKGNEVHVKDFTCFFSSIIVRKSIMSPLSIGVDQLIVGIIFQSIGNAQVPHSIENRSIVRFFEPISSKFDRLISLVIYAHCTSKVKSVDNQPSNLSCSISIDD